MRRGKNSNSRLQDVKRELLFKEDGQEYAMITQNLGNGRFNASCFDGRTRLVHVRGNMRLKIWIKRDDIVLIGLRSFQDDRADIIHVYLPEEVRELKSRNILHETDHENDNEDVLEFREAPVKPKNISSTSVSEDERQSDCDSESDFDSSKDCDDEQLNLENLPIHISLLSYT